MYYNIDRDNSYIFLIFIKLFTYLYRLIKKVIEFMNTSVVSNEQFKLLIPGYPEGSNITLINTSYVPRVRMEDDEGKPYYTNDYISILFRDNNTGEKHTYTIFEPLYTFYQLKDEYQEPDHNLFFIEKDKCKPVTCKHRDILRCIAEVTGNMEFYRTNIQEKNSGENRKLHTVPSIFMSDMAIENYYRFLFGQSYPNETFKLSKAFFDIEVDGKDALGSFVEPGECPVNAIAYCDEAHNKTYQFLLNDLKNPLLQEYKAQLESGPALLEELKRFVIKAVGGYKKAYKYGLLDMEYDIRFYDSEIDLLKDMFLLINKTSPDFLTVWNMAFDLDYIIARINELGYDPADIICDSSVKPTYLRFYIDERNKNEYAERGDFAAMSTKTVWLDQMIEFASRRKGRGQFESFKLDNIGEVIAKVKKLDYSHITSDINMLPRLNYKVFSFYNIMDVIVQKCIEVCTNDIDYVFTKCLINNTNYARCHRQSVYLANRFAKEFWSYGYIIGNNKNVWNEKPKIKFPGAMVGDPLHNDPRALMLVNMLQTLIAENAVDFDYSSLYPSIILENNIAPNTQIGLVIIEDPNDPTKRFSLNEHHDMYVSDDEPAKYSRGGEFLDNLMTGNPLEFCRRWLGLGTLIDVINDIKEFFKFNSYRKQGLDTKYTDGVYFVKNKMYDGVEFYDDSNNYTIHKPAVTFHNDLDMMTYEELVEKARRECLL